MSAKVDCFTEIEEVEAMILDFWNALDPDYIDDLVLDFKRRLHKCIELDGECVFVMLDWPSAKFGIEEGRRERHAKS